MLQVTDIAPQKKKQNRVSIFVNNDFWIGMDKHTQERLGLKIGLILEISNKRYIEEEVVYEEAFSKAINYLNYRMRTVQEIEKKLVDYDPPIIERVIKQLQDYNYVNDLEFAFELLHSVRTTGKGPKWFKNKAFEYGIPSEYVEQVLEESEYDNDNQVQEIKDYIVSQKLTTIDKQKLMRRLFSRGYDYDAIKQALDSL